MPVLGRRRGMRRDRAVKWPVLVQTAARYRPTMPFGAYLHGRGLRLGLLSIAPLLGVALATGDPVWLRAGLVGVSLVLGWMESGLTPLGVTTQAMAITALFLLLAATRDHPVPFSLIAAAAACAVVRLGCFGARLRTMAAFSFIPAVYLAFDVSAKHAGVHAALASLPAIAASLASVLAVMVVEQGCRRVDLGRWRAAAIQDWGAARAHALPVAAAALSVGLVTALVLCLPLTSGQWAVWSALSIVTADPGREGRKLRDRCVGACLGVPVGVLLSLALPHDRFVEAGAMLAAMMTLVAIRHYLACIASRWALVALAAAASGASPLAASERILDVVGGGAIGLLGVVLVRVLTGHLFPGMGSPPERSWG